RRVRAAYAPVGDCQSTALEIPGMTSLKVILSAGQTTSLAVSARTIPPAPMTHATHPITTTFLIVLIMFFPFRMSVPWNLERDITAHQARKWKAWYEKRGTRDEGTY